MADIFLSYAREDGAESGAFKPLVDGLQSDGFDVFWDRNIPAGTEYRSYVSRQLDECKCVIVLWSKHSTTSAWVLDEAEAGRSRGRLIPIVLDGVDQPMGFRQVQSIDFAEWRGDRESAEWRSLRTALSRFVAQERRTTGGLVETVGPVLPYLRRYARALLRSQSLGDGGVRVMLEALVADRSAMEHGLPARAALYRLFHAVHACSADALDRAALLLLALEGFSPKDAAAVLSTSVEDVGRRAERSRKALETVAPARILIVEDEPVIAFDLEALVASCGHSVCEIARTADDAVRAAKRLEPDAILSDVQLADGSSGLEAVLRIQSDMDLPVLFVTAYPERLLSGERREPTYLVTKPFTPDAVTVMINHILERRAGG